MNQKVVLLIAISTVLLFAAGCIDADSGTAPQHVPDADQLEMPTDARSEPQGPGETIPQNQENRSTQPETDVQDTWPGGIPFIVIGDSCGRSIRLSSDDHRYPAIETECRELIRCINAQIKTCFSRAELDAMKHNGTYVAINFSEPTTFETSYIVDGLPREITIDGAVFFLDPEDHPEHMIITPAQGGAGVWYTSCDRGELRDLVAQGAFIPLFL